MAKSGICSDDRSASTLDQAVMGGAPECHSMSAGLRCRAGHIQALALQGACRKPRVTDKHASALYIFAEARETGGGVQYRYASEALVGEGTDVFRLLRAIHAGLIYYDPADSVYGNGEQKVRPQWRMSSANLERTMRRLYTSVRRIPL